MFFSDCDATVAIDTNTPTKCSIDGLSIVGVAITRLSQLIYPKLIHISAQYAIEFRGLLDPKEKLGWLFGLKALYLSGLLKPEWRVAVIVDAYANEILDINRHRDVVDGIKLPDGVVLMYASGDTGQFYAINKCIKAADNAAQNALDAIVKAERADFLLPSAPTNPYFTSMRYWKFHEKDNRTIATGTPPTQYGELSADAFW